MTEHIAHKEWKFTAVTEIWTGDFEQKNNRLITTGLLGSIRWWFEVVVRILGGYTCDPTSDDLRCPEKNDESQGRHCVVCELFGCTGWARKFRFEVIDDHGEPIQSSLGAGTLFLMRFSPLRAICDEEWALLDVTLRLIAEYAAIGGRTVLKPSDEEGRDQAVYHKDYGLICLQNSPQLRTMSKERLESYIKKPDWQQSEQNSSFVWMKHFWAVKGYYLARQDSKHSTFNRVLGRPEEKERSKQNSGWLAGAIGESKKVFSFKTKGYERIYGFAENENDLKRILSNLKKTLPIENEEILIGQKILSRFLS